MSNLTRYNYNYLVYITYIVSAFKNNYEYYLLIIKIFGLM